MPEAAAVPEGVDPATGEVKEAPRPFIAILNEQREGDLTDELSSSLSEVVAAVVEHGKAGSLTLQLKINPAETGAGAVTIVDELKTKVPEPAKDKTLFFADKNGQLSRRDPRQMTFDQNVRELPKPEPITPKEENN